MTIILDITLTLINFLGKSNNKYIILDSLDFTSFQLLWLLQKDAKFTMNK